ncbi:MAG: PmoA family protein [Armatimonadetes bacterium]|nr:PmoA family protein [Armatimonadota bacterium]
MSRAECDKTIFQVEAGPHDRKDVLVSARCPSASECCACCCDASEHHSHALWLLDDKGNRVEQVPVQCVCDEGECEVFWKVADLPAGKTQRYELVSGDEAAEAPASEAGVTLTLEEGQYARFEIGGELFTDYVVKPEVARPYCYPVHGPGGLLMTNLGPSDHVHHKSMYVAQGDVNGQDNWSEGEGHAVTRNMGLEVVSQGPVLASLFASNDWVSAKGQQLMQEFTQITVYNTGPDVRVMDWQITWFAAYQGVHLGDTKEAGTLSVRVAESMEERKGGLIVNAYGAKTEAECWGKRAPWVDYSGLVADELVGLAIFDHPTNFRHPTYWHVRSYGLFTANEWGIHDFTGDWAQRGDWVIPQGWHLSFRFRVYIHRGDAETAQVGAKYLDFAYPPKVSIVEE